MDKTKIVKYQSNKVENSNNIEGVFCVDLKVIPLEDGAILHMLRADNDFFTQFGEVYFSELKPRSIKAWKTHSEQSQRITVPYGLLRVAIYDPRPQSPTHGLIQEVILGREQHKLLNIPPNVWYGFINLSDSMALICNCTDLAHDPTECLRKLKDDPTIPYKWI